ncbi:MAG: PilW family protein [Burkholderiales bacterium]|jgi:type IV pilus assembly protein PilW|nr:PilW family protein [Burkholderiales bacterium]
MKQRSEIKLHQGFTLVELMVGLTIGLLALLIITQVYALYNIQNRQVAGGNDAQQAATIINYRIGNILRQAGSNLLPKSSAWGCHLRAMKGADTLLPGGSWPEPFLKIPNSLRATPIAVWGASTEPSSRDSDVLLVLGGGSGTSAAFSATLNAGEHEFTVENSNGFLPSDYFLAANSADVGDNCYLFRVSPDFPLSHVNGKLEDTPKTISLDTRFMVSGSLTAMPPKISLFNLGVSPKLYMIGVHPEEKTLSLYDLLQNRNAGIMGSAVTLGENVFLLRVLYGVADPHTNGLTWQSPATSGWTFNELQKGTQDANDRLSQIRTLRIALVMRATYPSSDLSPESIQLFSSLGDSFGQTIALTDAERRYRYQVYETVVPLFNI